MGYLVKASFNAEPQVCSLERIRSDVAAKLLPASALVRHERQDFWYSAGELAGETPAVEFRFTCPSCKATTQAREVDVGLEVPCAKCGEMVMAPDIRPPSDPTPDLPLLRRGNLLLFWGAVISLGDLALCASGHGIFVVSRVIELVGVCMMINGYGKRKLYYLKHPAAMAPVSPSLTL